MNERIIFNQASFESVSGRFPIGFPCLSCQQNCCTDYLIFITHTDLRRIRERLPDLPLAQFLDACDKCADDYPAVMLEGVPRHLVIRKDARFGKCVFLACGVNMCAIHGFSPYICQMYPFQVPYDDYKELELRQEVMCPDQFLCPAQDIEMLIRIAREFWLHDLPEYQALVRRWNETRPQDSFEMFVEWLLESAL